MPEYLSPGVYIVRLDLAGTRLSRRLTVIR